MKERPLFTMVRRVAFLLSAAGLSLAVPAKAASVTALGFVEGGASANTFLIESSRLAEANGAGRRIVALARQEALDRPRIVAAFADWAAAENRGARAADFGPSLDTLGRFFGPTDRAVTIIAHQGRPALPDLAALHGRKFDDLYVASQRDALTRLVGLYTDFIKNGDDETLRTLAVHDLPRARQLLASLQRL